MYKKILILMFLLSLVFFISQKEGNHYYGDDFFSNKMKDCIVFSSRGNSQITQEWSIKGYNDINGSKYCFFNYIKPDIDYFVESFENNLSIRYLNYSCFVFVNDLEYVHWFDLLNSSSCSLNYYYEFI